MYRITQEEPEGWQKAFVVYFGEKRVTHCAFRSTAEDLVATLVAA